MRTSCILGFTLRFLFGTMSCLIVDDPIRLEAVPCSAICQTSFYLPREKLQRGNAATFYYGAEINFLRNMNNFLEDEDEGKRVNGWLLIPLNKFPTNDVRNFFSSYVFEEIFDDLEAAALRRCEWPWEHLSAKRKYELLGGIRIFGDYRRLVPLIGLKVRLHLAEMDYDEAISTLAVCMALARHLSQHPEHVHSSLGLSVSGFVLDRIEEFIQCSESPNLYWTLTSLPNPIHELSQTIRPGEHLFTGLFPVIRRWQHGIATENEIAKLKKDLELWMETYYEDELGQYLAIQESISDEMTEVFREKLVERGYRRMMVESMPTVQIVVLDCIEDIYGAKNEIVRLIQKPLFESAVLVEKASQTLHRAELRLDHFLTSEFVAENLSNMPDFFDRYTMSMTIERRVAILRIIESIRFFAAKNSGNLPSTLEELKSMPIPLDPITGKDFVYSQNGDIAIIACPADSFADEHFKSLQYELKLKK